MGSFISNNCFNAPPDDTKSLEDIPLTSITYYNNTFTLGQRLLYKHENNWCREAKITKILTQNIFQIAFPNRNSSVFINVKNKSHRYLIKQLKQFIQYVTTNHFPIAIIQIIEKYLPIDWCCFINCKKYINATFTDTAFRIGQWIDCKNENHIWKIAQIINVAGDNIYQVRYKSNDKLGIVNVYDLALLHSVVPIPLNNGMKFFRNTWIDFKDNIGFWHKAQITFISHNDVTRVQYGNNESIEFDLYHLHLNEHRFLQLHSKTYARCENGMLLKLYQRVLCKNRVKNRNRIYEGQIVQFYENYSSIKIHYDGCLSQNDDIVDLKKQSKGIQSLIRMIELFVEIHCQNTCLPHISDLIENCIEVGFFNVTY